MNELLSLLRDKKGLLKFLINTITSSEKNAIGLRSMKDRGFSQEGMLDKVIEVTAIQSNQIKHLALIALLLSQSRNFDSMVAETAMKLSNDGGEAVLKAMFDAKLDQ